MLNGDRHLQVCRKIAFKRPGIGILFGCPLPPPAATRRALAIRRDLANKLFGFANRKAADGNLPGKF